MKGLRPGQWRESSNKATLGSNEGALSSHGCRRCGEEGRETGAPDRQDRKRKLKEHETRGRETKCDAVREERKTDERGMRAGRQK